MKPIKDFGEILNGKPFDSTVYAAPKPKRMLPLQDEFPPDEVEVQPLALQDEFGDAAVEDVADGDGSDLETMLARYIEEELEQEEQAADLEHSDDEQESDAPAPGVPDEPDGPVEELDGPAGEPDQFVESGDVPMEAGSRQKLRIIPWGPQSIARKKNKRGKEVAFECRCGFHKLNAGTVCKKTISYNAGSEEHALIAAKYFLNQGALHRTQNDHLHVFDSIWEVPYIAHDILLQQQPTVVPRPEDIVTDIDVKKADAVIAAKRSLRDPEVGMGRSSAASSSAGDG